MLVMMPARMEGTPILVWRKAVTKPAAAPAAMAAGTAQDGVACDAHCHRHGRPQGESPIGGEIGNVQDAVAEEQSQGYRCVQQAQFQGCLENIEHSGFRPFQAKAPPGVLPEGLAVLCGHGRA